MTNGSAAPARDGTREIARIRYARTPNLILLPHMLRPSTLHLERWRPAGWTAASLPPARDAAVGSRHSSHLEGGAPQTSGVPAAGEFIAGTLGSDGPVDRAHHQGPAAEAAGAGRQLASHGYR